jgi:hypothetical protein
MKISSKFVAIITIIILLSRIFPEYWQLGITGAISFFLAYLIAKINNNKSQT